MRQVIALFNAGLGGLAAVAGVLALLGLVGAADRIRIEPEDVTSLALLTGLCVTVASASVVNAWLLLRSASSISRSARQLAYGLSLFACLLLIVGSIPGLNRDQPSSVELKYLLIPAVILALGAYGLRRHRES